MYVRNAIVFHLSSTSFQPIAFIPFVKFIFKKLSTQNTLPTIVKCKTV